MKPASAQNTETRLPWRADIDRSSGQNASFPPINGWAPDADRGRLSCMGALGNLGVGIVIANSSGKITLANATAKRLAQKDPQGKSLNVAPSIWGELFDASGRHIPVKRWPCIKALNGEHTVALECRFVRSDGRACDILFGSCPVKKRGSQIDGSFSSFTDFTEQKWKEDCLREVAIAGERSRLAADIHDTLVQGLNAVVLQLEALDQGFSADPEQVRAGLHRVRETAREGLVDARRSIWILSGDLPKGGDPATSLAFLARKLFADSPIRLQLHLQNCAFPLEADLRLALVRIGKEALTNVLKHSGATTVRVNLSYGRKLVRLSVMDNGRGFVEGGLTNTPGGFGLFGLRSRTEHLGGRLMIQSQADRGTHIIATIPLPG
jgi:signal transduction histidine kinase